MEAALRTAVKMITGEEAGNIEFTEVRGVAGIKEASTDITKIARILAECPESFCVWSGNDDMTVAIMALGGNGVISVASNVVPQAMKSMTDVALLGDYVQAADMQAQLMDLFSALFCEVNPIPVKAAMKILGHDCGNCRLPLTHIEPQNEEKLKELLL